MANASDLALLTGILLIGGVVLVGAAGVQLPGSNAVKDIISQPDNKETTKYELTTQVTVTSGGVKQDSTGEPYGFKYKTSKDTGFLSLASPGSLSFFTGAKDITVEYVLRTKSGRIVASNVKTVGKVGAFQKDQVTFTTGNLESGTYTATFVADYQKCVTGVCSRKTDKIKETVSVPKLPLGEY